QTGQGTGVAIGFGSRDDVLVADRDGDVRVWSVPHGTELRRGAFERGGSALGVGAGGVLASATGGRRELFPWWPVCRGGPRLLGSMEGLLTSAASRRWLVYAQGRRILLKHLEDWAAPPLVLAERPTGAEQGSSLGELMSFSHGGERLATFDASGEVRIWAI